MTSTNEIRNLFLDYFQRNEHTIVPSAPLLPHNDPTLMFVNAGMVPFKNVFTGQEKRDYVRATSSQKCVRAGGKHNDLDNVGYTARHHTFFEMLGNFSFGDYFKEKAIYYAWQFITKELELPPEKLLVTVYHSDKEARKLWQKISGFTDDKIIGIKGSDNFWAMGDTGPCGPCSEIFYDHGTMIPGGPPGSKDEDGDRFVEIWNLVFMQYNTEAGGERHNLPSPSIDTGMGLERIAAVLQGVHDNYDTDIFQAIIQQSQSITSKDGEDDLTAHKVIADHLRSSSFLLADGVMPSNEGRGYVLRRIMRRAMRYAHQLGIGEPLMYKLVPTLVQQMGGAYPELVRAQSLIVEMLKLEEENFSQTLGRGLKLLEKETEQVASNGVLPGDVAFKLYDTYGFPYDLTEDILRARHITIDQAGFEHAMNEQKARAKAAWKGSGEDKADDIWFSLKEQYGATEFLGYQSLTGDGTIIAMIVDGKEVNQAKKGDQVIIILDQTPFYAESGGQEGDRGVLECGSSSARVGDTKKYLGAIHAHSVKIETGELKLGDVVHAHVDGARREKLKANHSATHILHAVLREVLGDHVTQKGSLVAQDRLRFDISHPKAISSDELAHIEQKVNAVIRQNTQVATKVMAPEDAIKAGALALFGEKYGDEVRVLSMGDVSADAKAYSVELCGGTHVSRTGDIGCFKIIVETAIASGVRRIEALTGAAVIDYMQQKEQQMNEAAAVLKTSPDTLTERLNALLKERKTLEQELSKVRQSAALSGGSKDDVKTVNGISFIGKVLDGIPPKDLRELVMQLKQQIGSGVVAAVASFEGKSSCIIAVTDDLTSNISATDLITQVTALLGAKGGGGKPNFAQTGGTDVSQLHDVIGAIEQSLKR